MAARTGVLRRAQGGVWKLRGQADVAPAAPPAAQMTSATLQTTTTLQTSGG